MKIKIETSSEDKMNHLSSELKIKYELIENESALITLINEILDNKIIRIGLDTEYYKGNNYQGNLCLFQISYILNSNKKVFIIDLLKFDKNFIKNNFEKILFNEKIEKIIHASENDVEWIYEDYGIFVKNVFDTQEVFTFIADSSKRVGLNFLLNYYIKLNLEKQTKKYFQTSNWKQRPLIKEQLDYAALDTLYLIDIRDKIYQDLKDKMNIIKKNKKKRLIENAESLIVEVLNGLNNNHKTLVNTYDDKKFVLDNFEEIHKNNDYDKYFLMFF
jgi:ribonuclease D